MIRNTWLVILFIFLTGCATPEAEILSKTDSYPPTTNIEVLLDRPTRPFKSFAILEDTYGGTPEEINGRLSRKAQQIGADAIIISSINDKAVTEWLLVDPYYNARGAYRPRYRPIKHVYRSVRARAIKYLEK
ncbi:MAG: hypothetical protein Q7J84_07205 [Sulfuricaulis sp.]|nr:hypothetical protein [Sulfuricaulis sp.]